MLYGLQFCLVFGIHSGLAMNTVVSCFPPKAVFGACEALCVHIIFDRLRLHLLKVPDQKIFAQ